MTTFVGNGGTILAGSNAIGSLRSYSIEETTETIDDSVMGATYQTHKGGNLGPVLLMFTLTTVTQPSRR